MYMYTCIVMLHIAHTHTYTHTTLDVPSHIQHCYTITKEVMLLVILVPLTSNVCLGSVWIHMAVRVAFIHCLHIGSISFK